MSEVEFIYNGITTIIQCKLNDKMKNICQKFKEKANINDNTSIFYSYDGKVGFNEELSFEEIANREDKRRNKMNILVYANQTIIINNNNGNVVKSKNIICPECNENIKMDIKDYKINLCDCKNGHRIENILLNEFEETQKIDLLNIICDICKKNNKSISYNNIFYKCLTCDENICPLCKSEHDKAHKIINYDDKYYICRKHNENYILYCEDCKVNICMLCDNHKKHKRNNFIDILPKKEDLVEKINILKKYINQFNNVINELLLILNDVKNKMNIYYKINEDIINNYDNKNRNYETLYYLNQFQNNNIINELKKINKCNSIKDKFNEIFNIYRKMNVDEIKMIYKVKNLKEVQLFGTDFVERNKNNCNLIIEGEEQGLKQVHSFGIFFGTDKEYFEVKLKGITNITDMSKMFYECTSLISLPDISKFNTSNITDMSGIFGYCLSLTSLPDISKWNTSNVTNMSGMFLGCISLTSLPEISKWNTSNVTHMNVMFCGCESLSSLPDISNWDITNLESMYNMFYKCKESLVIPSKFKHFKCID